MQVRFWDKLESFVRCAKSSFGPIVEGHQGLGFRGGGGGGARVEELRVEGRTTSAPRGQWRTPPKGPRSPQPEPLPHTLKLRA